MNELWIWYGAGCLMGLLISVCYLVAAYRMAGITIGQLTVSLLITLASWLGVVLGVACFTYDHWNDIVIRRK